MSTLLTQIRLHFVKFVVVESAVVLSLSNPFLQFMENLFEARKSIPRILQNTLATSNS